MALANENHHQFTSPIALTNGTQKRVQKKIKKIARPPFLLPLPAASKLLSARPQGGPGALCNLLAAGRGSKARQGEATQGARHCRVRPGECNTKTSKQGRARQQRTRRANTKQHKARQGKTRQGKERVNNDNTEGEREERARRSKARRGKTEHGKARQWQDKAGHSALQQDFSPR